MKYLPPHSDTKRPNSKQSNILEPSRTGTGGQTRTRVRERERDCPTAVDLPRVVIRGESLSGEEPHIGESLHLKAIGNHGRYQVVRIPCAKADAEPQAAFTDWLNTTFPFAYSRETLVELVRSFRLFLGEPFGTLSQRNGGLHGYQVSFFIGETGGLFAYGGQRGTGLVSLPGAACALIEDWASCYHLFHDILNARLTRWDGAIDQFDGLPSVDDAVNFYLSDLFNCGGNRPSCRQIGNWLQTDGSGRTFEVGKRKNGKLMRIYEKGKQLGDPDSPWVRWELELHNRDRFIPWDVILEPGKYLAAAYPCMSWVNDIQERIRTTQKTAQISYEHLVYYASQAYGPLINVMLDIEGSAEKVIERLIRTGVPQRLQLSDREKLAQLIREPEQASNDANPADSQ